ncbi:MAG: aminoacyl-tRNA hydrolase [Alphaproteobacteria bacterium]
MKLFVGLGNPGPEHARNRHNIGFMALDTLARCHEFAPFRPKYRGLAVEGRLGRTRILALKPLTYMNDSGLSVAEAARFHKIAAESVYVFHDELDLAAGKMRVKLGGGNAGHNGLRSIDAHLGTEYWRVRLGIGHPGDKARVLGWVLRDFPKADAEWLDPFLAAIADHAPLLAEGREPDFMSKVALALQPPAAETKRPARAPRANENE